MRQVNCLVPLVVRLRGFPDDERLAETGEAIARTVAGRLAEASRVIATREGWNSWYKGYAAPEFRFSGALLGADMQRRLAVAIEAGIARAITGGPGVIAARTAPPQFVLARFPSSTSASAAPVRRRAPPHRRRPARGWRILLARDFYTTIGKYAEYFDKSENPSIELGNLYAGMADQQRRVAVWLVQLDRAYRLRDLASELIDRATELSRPSTDQVVASSVGFLERHRQDLIRLDSSGTAEQTIPALNDNYLSEVHGEVYVSRGARVFLTAMVLPKIRLADYLRLEPVIELSLRFRDLEFLISPAGFESWFHVSWAGFLASYGDRETTLRILRMQVLRRAEWETIDALVEQATNVRAGQEDARNWWRLEPLNRSFLDEFPEAVKQAVAGYTSSTTLALSDTDRWAPWQPGWRAAILWASFQVTADQGFAIKNQAGVGHIADRLITHLSAFDKDILWWFKLHDIFKESFTIFGAPAGVRTIFDLVMQELEAREDGRWFKFLLDTLDTSQGDATRAFLEFAFVSTNYTNHPCIVAMRDRYNADWQEALRSRYFPDEIWLKKDRAKRVLKGVVVADVVADYSRDQKEQVLVESRRAEFEKALDTESKKLVEEIVKGREKRDFDVTEFTNEVVKRAAQSIKLTNDDFEKVTVTYSARVKKVEPKTEFGLQHYEVTWNLVKRIDGGPWEDVPDTEREPTIDYKFDDILFWWETARGVELITTGALIVAAVGIVLVAWEAGVIAALVDFAGGATVVLSSIVLSEILTLIHKGRKFTLEDFVIAAIDGYLYALTFRFAGLGGRAIAARIGTSTMNNLVGGWVAERLVTGIVGGGAGGALSVFAHGVAGVLLGNSNFPTLGDFVRGMTIGAVMGLAGEFIIGPALQAAFRVGGQTALSTIGEAVKVVRESGTSPARYAALVGEALGALRQRLAQFLEAKSVEAIMTALREHLAELGEALARVPGAVKERFELALFRRIFEVADIGLGPLETDGLERLLAATEAGGAQISQGELQFFLNGLARDPAQAQRVLQGLGRLAEDRVSALIAGGQLDAFAGANHLLRNLLARDVDLVWEVWNSGSFGFRIGDFEAWLGRISGHSDNQQLFALEVLRRPDQLITPEGLTQALDKTGLTVDIVAGLDRLYGAVGDPALANAIMTGVARDNAQAYLLFIGRLHQDNANQLADQGYLQPLSTAPRVLAFASRGENLEILRGITARLTPTPGNVREEVQGLEEFFTREPNLTPEQQVATARQLQGILAGARAPRRGFSELETLRTVTQRAREAGLGSLERGVETVGRLISDNVDPRVAREMLAAPPGTDVTAVEVPGPGGAGPDVLFETPAGLIGRESVTVTPRNFRPATARNDIRGRIIEAVVDKVNSFGAGPAARPNYLLREIDVQIRRAADGNSFDAVLEDGLFQNVIAEVGTRSQHLGLIGRARFYDSTGALIFTWTP